MGFIKVYTREPVDKIYSHIMAGSVHFAYSADGKEYINLNQNYGILFAKADIRDNNTIRPFGIRNPMLRKEDGRYAVYAEVVDEYGKPVDGTGVKPSDMTGEETVSPRIIKWTTTDFVNFSEQETVDVKLYPEGASDTLEIDDDMWQAIKNRWVPLESVDVKLPDNVCINDISELDNVKATVTYSDGSTCEKKVIWDKDSIVKKGGGRYAINGRVKQVKARFPMAVGYADPVVFNWEAVWYFLATNDNVNDIGMFVRKADNVDGLFAEGVKEYCILDRDEEKGFVQTFWAPEFHVIGGRLYILFAVSGKQWGPQCHMMRLKEGGSITNPDDWEQPIRVMRQNKRPLTEDGITLDMTYFKAGAKSYLVWSYRHGIGTPLDSGSMLYIATTDEGEPWKLTSEPVLLSRPLYAWENTSGTINNEGPYALVMDDKVWLAYSGGDACGHYYVVGFITASTEDDLLDIRNWKKQPTAALSFASIDGIEGPGHNSFFRDEDGAIMIAYHAQEREKYFKRCTTMHRVHISRDGMPMLNVEGGRDLAERLINVSMEYEW